MSTNPAHTLEYPDVDPALPPRSRGVIALLQENCTSCMLCARECPDWCIYIDSHKETIPPTDGGHNRPSTLTSPGGLGSLARLARREFKHGRK